MPSSDWIRAQSRNPTVTLTFLEACVKFAVTVHDGQFEPRPTPWLSGWHPPRVWRFADDSGTRYEGGGLEGILNIYPDPSCPKLYEFVTHSARGTWRLNLEAGLLTFTGTRKSFLIGLPRLTFKPDANDGWVLVKSVIQRPLWPSHMETAQ